MSGIELNKKSFLEDALEGLALANPELLALEKNMVINRSLSQAERVTLVAMSTAGNEPALAGYVGEGLLDIAVVGNMDSAPGPARVLEAIGLADRGHGVLLLVLDNSGDILTSNIVLKQADKQGLFLKKVVIPGAEDEKGSIGQGSVGILPVLKLAGAAAAEGKSLEEIAELAEAAVNTQLTLAITSQGKTAEALAELTVTRIAERLQLEAGDKVLLLINGNGVISLQEQLVLYKGCYLGLSQKELVVIGGANNYFCGLAGITVEICCVKMTGKMLQLWQQPCKAAYFQK